MSDTPDPLAHRTRERQIMTHIERLLSDDRLRIDTTRGRRPVVDFERNVDKIDHAVDLKRLMSQIGKPDRSLESQMPIGEEITADLMTKRWWFFKSRVGRFRAVVIAPTRQLLDGATTSPLDTAAVRKLLSASAPPTDAPETLVLISTSGFKLEAHELAVRGANRTVILVEPNAAGGWSAYGPTETKSLVDLFDPEEDDAKRLRLTQSIEAMRAELGGSGIAADKLAGRTQLPLAFVENELKSYAKANPGLTAKRLDGRWVMFRESSMPPQAGGSDMPLVDRIKSLFGKSDNVRKIAFLAERRTALSQQRDRAYEELNTHESSETTLRDQFKQSTSDLAKRRITSQLLQLRKDIERRQQLMTVLNQQINVVSTHLHNLELVQQGTGAKLPNSEEMATDAAAAEEMLADLQANSEVADSVTSAGGLSMSDEEQALFDELEKEAKGTSESSTTTKAVGGISNVPPDPASIRTTASRPGDRVTPQRSEPEAG